MRSVFRTVASQTQLGVRGKKNSGGAKYLSFFLKYEVIQRHKRAEEAKA